MNMIHSYLLFRNKRDSLESLLNTLEGYMGKMSLQKKNKIRSMLNMHYDISYIAKNVGVSERTVAEQSARLNKIAKVESLYNCGVSANEISEKTGISISSVYTYIRNIKHERKINEIIEMTKSGASAREIVQKTGLSLTIVNFYRRELLCQT